MWDTKSPLWQIIASAKKNNTHTSPCTLTPTSAHVDVRLPPTISIPDFEAMVAGWMEDGVTYEWVFSTPINKMTAADDR